MKWELSVILLAFYSLSPQFLFHFWQNFSVHLCSFVFTFFSISILFFDFVFCLIYSRLIPVHLCPFLTHVLFLFWLDVDPHANREFMRRTVWQPAPSRHSWHKASSFQHPLSTSWTHSLLHGRIYSRRVQLREPLPQCAQHWQHSVCWLNATLSTRQSIERYLNLKHRTKLN